MNKTFTKLVLAAVAVIGFSVTGKAQTTATVNSATAGATIIAPITLAETTPMDFGSIIKGAGTVTLQTDDSRTFTNAAMQPGLQGVGTAAVFTVGGEANYTYSISLGTGSITDGNTPLNLTLTSNKTTGTLTGGADTFLVGAAITLDGSEAAGAYTGSYDVTVAYN